MRVAVVQNCDHTGVIQKFGPACPEKYGARTIQRVADSLREYGHEVLVCEGNKNLLATLEEFMPPSPGGQPCGMVFNMAYGIQGECRYTHVPAMLEMAGVPYTGSTPLGHALALDKVITKDLLRQARLPTPRYMVMRTGEESPEGLSFPLVAKPRHESTSFGLSLVENRAQLGEAVRAIVERYRQEALVEEYIEGREFCVGLLGNDQELECFPVLEQDFTGCEVRMMTWACKFHGVPVEPQKFCPAPLDESIVRVLHRIAKATFEVCHCRDYARVDLRLDPAGQPYVLEINSMASLGGTGSYVYAATAAGYTYAGLVNHILDIAHQRYFGVPARVDSTGDERGRVVAYGG